MIDPGLRAQVGALLAQRSPDTVPSGVLMWFGRTDLGAGGPDDPPLSPEAWTATYARLVAGALPGALPPVATVLAQVQAERYGAVVPLAIVDVDVERPRADVVAAFAAAAAAGRAHCDVAADLVDLVEPGHVFAVGALLPPQWKRRTSSHVGSTVTYRLDGANYLTNRGRALPDRLAVDFGDGRGERTLPWGTTITIDHGDDVEVTITVRVGDGATARVGRATLPLLHDAPPPTPDERWRLTGDPYEGVAGTGWAGTYLGRGNAALTRPVVLVEGFPGGASADYLYAQMNGPGLLDRLRAAGHDIVIVGFDRGTDLMQRNAGVVVAAIGELRARTSAPAVAGGFSMGGLLVRYALCTMERASQWHGVATYLSVDTPHGRGSYTSPADQWFIQELGSIDPRLAVFGALLDSPANQQFLRWWVHDGTAATSPLREQFLADLAAIGGYPATARLLAVSCGRGDGVASMEAGATILDWTGSPFASATLTALAAAGEPTTMAQGACIAVGDGAPPASLPLADDVCWDAAPGGQNVYTGLIASVLADIGCGAPTTAVPLSCSVPTVSALDLDGDPFAPVPAPGTAGPFHDFTTSSVNRIHLDLEPAVVDWIVERLTDPPANERPDA
jgi:hypothetical protein